MNRIVKRTLSALMCLLIPVISGAGIGAAAATNLPNSFLIGDQNGLRVDTDGAYLIEVNDVLPGEKIYKKLTIQNLDVAEATSETAEPFHLNLRMEPLTQSGPVDLLDTKLELMLDGKPIYSGTCRGDDAIKTALDLGTCEPGDQHILEITMTVDADIKLEDWIGQTSEATFRWTFYAWRDSAKTTNPPKTGVLDSYATHLLFGMAVFCLTVIVLKRKNTHAITP